MVPIKVSSANAGAPMVLIESGLSAGDNVVVDGQVKLRPGVTVKATAAPRPATSAASAPQ
jgi:multidrug efflux pump subunit AcrA (membrane-fusion protein)